MRKWLVGGCILFMLLLFSGFKPWQRVLPQIFRTQPVQPDVVTVSDGSRTHVQLTLDGVEVQVSSGSANYRKPFRRGDFIVWLEVPQDRSEKYVVRYHIPTKTQLRLTQAGVSQHARVNTQGAAVWQQWVDDTWQVFYFDGIDAKQITEGTNAHIHPDIYEQRVVFATQDNQGVWHIEEYDVLTNQQKSIPNSIGEKYPQFIDNTVSFISVEAAKVLEADD